MVRYFEKWGDRGTFAWRDTPPKPDVESEPEDGGGMAGIYVGAAIGMLILLALGVWWAW